MMEREGAPPLKTEKARDSSTVAAPAEVMGPSGPLFAALVFFAVEWSILYWMYKKRLFLSA